MRGGRGSLTAPSSRGTLRSISCTLSNMAASGPFWTLFSAPSPRGESIGVGSPSAAPEASMYLPSSVLARAADPDAALLERFARQGDEAAFACLAQRHAPLVRGVCGRLLPAQDAEDAVQATFLVLAKKAGSIDRGALPGWLD